MGKLADLLTKRVEERIQSGLDAFAEGLVEDVEHPVITGITRGNWQPSINNPKKVQDYFGYSFADIYDAMQSRTELISLQDAKEKSLGFKWELGDTVIWTNSLEHIGELEHRRKFFDTIVENSRQKAQRAMKSNRTGRG